MPSGSQADDDQLTDQMGSLFSAVKGPPRVPKPPAATTATPTPPPSKPPADAPPPTKPPTPAAQAMTAAEPLLLLDRKLDAILHAVHLLERRFEQLDAKISQAEQVTEAVDDRLEEVAQALFDWIESFTDWQAKRLDRLDALAKGPGGHAE